MKLKKLKILVLLSCLFLQNKGMASEYVTPAYQGSGLTVYGDFIYWKAVQDQIQYAAVLKGGVQGIIAAFSSTPVQLSTDFTFIEPCFEYKPGFRIGADYAISCMNLDIELAWTRLHQNVCSRISDPNRGIIPLTMLASSALGFINGEVSEFGFAREARSNWQLHFDVVDLQIGSCYCLNYVSLHPFIGVKYASINQSQKIEYIGFAIEEVPINLRPSKKNNFYGVGPSLGFASAWEFCSHWSLTGGVGTALLYGKFDANERPLAVFEDNFITVKAWNSKKYRLRPVIDANIGLNWDTCFCNCFNVELGIAYELQYWWNQWQALPSVLGGLLTGGNSPQGDLTIQGLTASLAISF